MTPGSAANPASWRLRRSSHCSLSLRPSGPEISSSRADAERQCFPELLRTMVTNPGPGADSARETAPENRRHDTRVSQAPQSLPAPRPAQPDQFGDRHQPRAAVLIAFAPSQGGSWTGTRRPGSSSPASGRPGITRSTAPEQPRPPEIFRFVLGASLQESDTRAADMARSVLNARVGLPTACGMQDRRSGRMGRRTHPVPVVVRRGACQHWPHV